MTLTFAILEQRLLEQQKEFPDRFEREPLWTAIAKLELTTSQLYLPVPLSLERSRFFSWLAIIINRSFSI